MRTAPRRKAIARARLLAAVAVVSASSAPTAVADTGQPQQSGGCHMVASPSTTGVGQMMTKASNTAAQNMVAMLSKFSRNPFCGA